ncbi:1510_t:CDS:1, partial [Gigaspora margarita]
IKTTTENDDCEKNVKLVMHTTKKSKEKTQAIPEANRTTNLLKSNINDTTVKYQNKRHEAISIERK